MVNYATFLFHVALCWHFSDLCKDTTLLQYNVANKIVVTEAAMLDTYHEV